MCRMVFMGSNDLLTQDEINNIWDNIVAMAKDETIIHEFHEEFESRNIHH